MQLDVFFLAPLFFDVFADSHLVALLANGSRIIAVRPEFSTPQLLFDMWTPKENLPSCDALDELGQSRDAVAWNRLDKKMHMIFVCSNLQKDHGIAFLNLKTYIPQSFIHLWIKNYPAVLRWTSEMIQQNRNIMTFMDIPAHTTIISPGRSKLRGIKPGEIKNITQK